MSLQDKSESTPLDKIYLEASQWVRLANTIIWSMGTLLVPVSFGFVGLALNKFSGTQFTQEGKVILGVGSVFLFSFWVYASYIYKSSSNSSRKVLIRIEKRWKIDAGISLYKLQRPIVNCWFSLLRLQIVTLVALVGVWVYVIWCQS
jgi:hypothetical protein